MAQLVFVVGKSGSGKSTSLRNLDENETVIVNSDQKALPFKNFKEKYNDTKNNYLKTNDISLVLGKLKECHKNPKVKTIIIDTLNRLATDYTNSPAFRAENGFTKWDRFAGGIYDLITIINDKLRDDLIVYIFCHPGVTIDESGFTSQKIMTPGKKLENLVLESFSTIVLYTTVIRNPGKENEYCFSTRCNNDSAKTPMGMFEELLVPNDLVEINAKIREYYGI